MLDFSKKLDDRIGRENMLEPIFDFSKSKVGQLDKMHDTFTPSIGNLQLGMDEYVKVEPNQPLQVDAFRNVHGAPAFERTDTGFQRGPDAIARIDNTNT
jgi:hypothetical protein